MNNTSCFYSDISRSRGFHLQERTHKLKVTLLLAKLEDRDKNSHRNVSFGERGFDRIVSIAFFLPPVDSCNIQCYPNFSPAFPFMDNFSLAPSIFSLLQFTPRIFFLVIRQRHSQSIYSLIKKIKIYSTV